MNGTAPKHSSEAEPADQPTTSASCSPLPVPESRDVIGTVVKPRLLLVEDDAATTRALRAIFTRRGWDVESVSTLEDAIALLDTLPDCVILDLVLPDGDGLEVLRTIRDKGLSIRVAVTTGVSDEGRLKVVADLHPDIVLSKPVNLQELLDILGIGHKGTAGKG